MPQGSRGAPVFIAGFGGPTPMLDVYVPFNQPARFRVVGVTRDSTGAILGNCVVQVYESSSQSDLSNAPDIHGKLRGSTESDANGNYSFELTGPSSGLTFTVVAYRAGSPDVAGVSVNTLVSVEG